MDEKKLGVYLCSGCGIGEAVSVDGLAQVATKEFRVPVVKKHGCLCSDEGAKLIADDIAAGAVNRAVVAACSPRVNTDRFRFDGTPVVRANLREQVAWSQPPGAEDTQMLAADYVRMAIAEAGKTNAPQAHAWAAVSKRILVVGGGVAGLTAAIEAARTGYDVLLVERSDALGGQARLWSTRMPHAPPYRDPQPNDTDDLIAAVRAEPRITVRTDCTVAKTSGAPGGSILGHTAATQPNRTGWIML